MSPVAPRVSKGDDSPKIRYVDPPQPLPRPASHGRVIEPRHGIAQVIRELCPHACDVSHTIHHYKTSTVVHSVENELSSVTFIGNKDLSDREGGTFVIGPMSHHEVPHVSWLLRITQLACDEDPVHEWFKARVELLLEGGMADRYKACSMVWLWNEDSSMKFKERWGTDLGCHTYNSITIDNFIIHVRLTRIERDRGKERLSEDLRKMWDSEDYTVVKVKVKNRQFRVLKSLLCARSEVFAFMLQYLEEEDDEELSRTLDIQDVNPSVFRKVLEYVYTADVEEMRDYAPELLEAADKYRLVGLREKVEEHMVRTVNSRTALRTLMFAHKRSATRAKQRALEVAADHLDVVRHTSEWRELKRKYPHLNQDVKDTREKRKKIHNHPRHCDMEDPTGGLERKKGVIVVCDCCNKQRWARPHEGSHGAHHRHERKHSTASTSSSSS